MGSYAIVISLINLLSVPIFELVRKKERIIDYLTLINLIYIVAFGVAPIYMYLFPNDVFEWRVLIYNDLNDTRFFIGSLISLLFYVITAYFYYLSNKLTLVRSMTNKSEKFFGEFSDRKLRRPAFWLLIVGGASLFVYMNVVGGFNEYLRIGRIIRNDGSYMQHSLMFLKNITPLITVASFMYYAFIGRSKGFGKFINVSLFLITFICSLLVVFHSGGRMTTFIYIVTFPIAKMLYKNKFEIRKIIIGSALFMFMVIYGSSLLNIESDGLEAKRQNVSFVNSIIREFSFPFVNVGTLFDKFPHDINFRWGIPDVLDAVIGLIPSRIISISKINEQSVSVVNTKFYPDTGGVMPVDIISFGYISFGIAGVIITATLFGVLARVTENLFSYRGNLIACMFSVSLMIVFSFRFMYGDPVMIMDSLFKYIVSFLFIMISFKLPRIVWSEKRRLV